MTTPALSFVDVSKRFGQLDGHISLALRAPSDYAVGVVSTSGITLQMLVEQYGVLPPLPVTP